MFHANDETARHETRKVLLIACGFFLSGKGPPSLPRLFDYILKEKTKG